MNFHPLKCVTALIRYLCKLALQ